MQLFSTNRNYFLHSCNFFLQYCNFFLQTATFFYKSQLFSTIFQLSSMIHNFFLQITTFFCKIAAFFHRRNKRVFSLDKREKRYFISLPHVSRGWQVDCFGWIPEREGWLPNYLSHVFALSAWWMDKFLCTWRYWSECGYCVDMSQAWPKVYATTKRVCYFGWWSDGNRVWGLALHVNRNIFSAIYLFWKM